MFPLSVLNPAKPVYNRLMVKLLKSHPQGTDLEPSEKLEFTPAVLVTMEGSPSLYCNFPEDSQNARELVQRHASIPEELVFNTENMTRSLTIRFVAFAGQGSLESVQAYTSSREISLYRDINRLVPAELQFSIGATKTRVPEEQWGKSVLLGALHAAAYNGELAVVEHLIGQDEIQLELRNSVEQTALLIAAFKGREKVVTALLKAGANPLAVCQNLYNLLHYAVLSRDIPTIKTCLKSKAAEFVNTLTKPGLTPLHLVATYLPDEDDTCEIIQLLIAAGADPKLAVTQKQLTPNDFAKLSKPKMAALLAPTSSAKPTSNPAKSLKQKLVQHTDEHPSRCPDFVVKLVKAAQTANVYNDANRLLREVKPAADGMYGAVKAALLAYNGSSESAENKRPILRSAIAQACRLYSPTTFEEKLEFSILIAILSDTPYQDLNKVELPL